MNLKKDTNESQKSILPINERGDSGEPHNFKSKDEILNLTPAQLRDYFVELNKIDKLEAFLSSALDDEFLLAQFSYWEKWFETEQQQLLEKIIAKKKEIYPGDKDSLPLNLKAKFTRTELDTIIANLGFVQLTYGCSKGCPFCGFDAVKGVREYIPYPQLANLFRLYGKEIGKNQPILYYASEPADYKFEDKTYEDVSELATKYGGYFPHVTTNETENGDWLNFLNYKFAWSMMQKGKDKTVNPRMSLFGKPKAGEISQPHTFITTIGEGEQHAIGIGKSSERKDAIAEKGIGCINGFGITPRGLYSHIVTHISEKYPQGIAVVPFDGFRSTDIVPGESVLDVIKNFIPSFKNVNKGKYDARDEEPWNNRVLNNIKVRDRNNQEILVIFNHQSRVYGAIKWSECDIYSITKYDDHEFFERQALKKRYDTDDLGWKCNDPAQQKAYDNALKQLENELHNAIIDQLNRAAGGIDFRQLGDISVSDIIEIQSAQIESKRKQILMRYKMETKDKSDAEKNIQRDQFKEKISSEFDDLKNGDTEIFQIYQKDGRPMILYSSSSISFEINNSGNDDAGEKINILIGYNIVHPVPLGTNLPEEWRNKKFSINQLRDLLGEELSNFQIVFDHFWYRRTHAKKE